jgi:Arm DNA-binding domain
MALTDAAIRATKPAKKLFKMYDREGLFLPINPGGSKLWHWRYWAGGKEKLMALGEHPIVNLAEARECHFAARKKVAAGIDPIAGRKAEAESRKREAEARQREAENSFEKIARKWWEWWAAGKSPRHTDYVLRRLETDVFPAFGHKFIDNITPADIRKLMLAIEGRGASDAAKRAHERTGQIFRYAIAHGIASKPPRRLQAQGHSGRSQRRELLALRCQGTTHATFEDGQLRWRCDYAPCHAAHGPYIRARVRPHRIRMARI